MQDEPDVRPVDAHPERHRGDDQVARAGPKGVMRGLPLAGIQVGRLVRVGGPIAHGVEPKVAQAGRQPVHFLARRAVNDPGLPLAALQYLEDLVEHLAPAQHPVDQVRPIEVADEDGRVAQVELVDDVLADRLGGGGREGVEGGLRELVADRRELPVLGSKIVPPVADAVGFIDGKRAHADFAEEVLEPLGDHPLRRGEQQANSPGAKLTSGEKLFRIVQCGVDAQCRHVGGGQAIDLILHQRNERRDNDGRLGRAIRGRCLVAERLAAARGHDDERIAPIEVGADRLFLKRPEGMEAPVAGDEGPEFGQGIGGHRSLSNPSRILNRVKECPVRTRLPLAATRQRSASRRRSAAMEFGR